MQKGFMLLALLLCSCGPGLPKATVPPSPKIEAEEYAVYSALIRQNPIGYNLGSYFVVRENTRVDLDMFERTLEREYRVYAIDVMGQPGKSFPDPDEPIRDAAGFVA